MSEQEPRVENVDNTLRIYPPCSRPVKTQRFQFQLSQVINDQGKDIGWNGLRSCVMPSDQRQEARQKPRLQLNAWGSFLTKHYCSIPSTSEVVCQTFRLSCIPFHGGNDTHWLRRLERPSGRNHSQMLRVCCVKPSLWYTGVFKAWIEIRYTKVLSRHKAVQL